MAKEGSKAGKETDFQAEEGLPAPLRAHSPEGRQPGCSGTTAPLRRADWAERLETNRNHEALKERKQAKDTLSYVLYSKGIFRITLTMNVLDLTLKTRHANRQSVNTGCSPSPSVPRCLARLQKEPVARSHRRPAGAEIYHTHPC